MIKYILTDRMKYYFKEIILRSHEFKVVG